MARTTVKGAILAGLMLVIGLLAACGVDQVRSVPATGEPIAAAPSPPPPSSPTALKPPGLARAPVATSTSAPRIVERVSARGVQAAPPGQTAPGSRAVGDITLRFDETDIREVAAVILRDLLKANYLIDPDVTGTVTLSTSRPLTREQLLPTLEALLSSRGAALINNDGLYRVTLLREGVRPGQVPKPRLGGRPEPGQGIEVFALEHIAAPEMAKVLEPVLPRGRLLAVDAARGLLMVSGNTQELEAARETVRIFDLDQMAGTSVLLVTLQNAEAAQLVPELENIFSVNAKGAEGGSVRFMAVERLNGVLVISRARRALDDAQSWILRLDRTRRSSEPQLYVYYVQHGKAAEVAKTLQGVFGTEGEGEAGAAPRPANVAGLSAPSAFNLPQEGPAPGEAAAPEAPRAAPAPAAGQRLEVAPPIRGERGAVRIRADEATNALLIQAIPRDYERVQQVLQQIDILPLQVLIEANIIEVTLSNQLRYGLQYFLNTGGLGLSAQGRVILTRQTQTDSTGTVSINPPIPGFSFSFLNSAGNPQAIIDLLSDLTQVSILSSPQLLVLDNQVARLQVGEQVPIQTQSLQTFNTTSNLQVLNAIQYRDTGVTLEVTPRVNAGGTVVLDINQTVSQVAPTTSSNINSPTFRQRRLVSSVAAQSGNTILLGGLIREDTDRGDSGIPLLHELPLIGALFGGKRELITRTELVVMLTPRVVRNAEEARDLTQEMRRRYQAVLTYQQERPRPPGPTR